MQENKLYSIWLSTLNGLTPVKIKSLIQTYKTAKKLYFMSADELKSEPLEDTVRQALMNKRLDRSKQLFSECTEKGIDILEYNDEYYPPLLRRLSNPPFLLYKKGLDIDYRNYPLGAVVGSRILSDYGRAVTERLSFDMAKKGFIVVSGMAHGADAVAHLSALKGGMPSVAVLGCGVDVVYPSENRQLYEYLCEYGAVLSEYLPGTSPINYNFPQRNRIVSGMSHLTVVTEARLKSGSLITAEMTHNQGKQVFAVPQNINSAYGQGTNQILKEYAHVITKASDAYNYYCRACYDADCSFPSDNEAKKGRAVKKSTTAKKQLHNNSAEKLDETEIKILNALKDGPMHINKIAHETGCTLGKIRAVVSLLEIKGLLYTASANTYAIKAGLHEIQTR